MGHKREIPAGFRSGRLVVVEEVGKDKNGCRMFKCMCDCGTMSTVRLVQTVPPRSCGCLVAEISRPAAWAANTKPAGDSSLNSLMSVYKDRARKKYKCEFSIPKSNFKELCKKDCNYCGSSPKNVMSKERCNGAFVYNGLDRVDPSKGYTLDNVVPSCAICNKMKGSLFPDGFLTHIRKVLSFHDRISS